MLAAKYAREHGVPYFGICYGMHAAVVDFARHVAGLTEADSSENDRNTPDPVIGLITEWTTASGEVEQRSDRSDLGGTMRLGAQECRLKTGTLARELYGQDVVRERHRHRYEFNNRYRQSFEDKGLVISGKSMDDLLVEMVELSQQQHPWFLAARRIRSSHPPRATGIRCSSASCARHANTSPCARASVWHRSHWHETLRFRGRPGSPAVPDRRPLRGRVRTVAARYRRHAQGNHRPAGHAVHLQIQLRQGQPLLRR